MDNRTTSRIKFQLDGVDAFNKDDWQKINQFIIDGAVRMYKVFKDRVQKMKADL